MELLNVDTLERAREKLLEHTAGWACGTETLCFEDAAGRVLARDITAPEDVPGFLRSTVDGYAVRACDTAAAGESIPAFLRLAGSVEMGQAAGIAISAGQCAQVPTGGMLPDGADAVVMVEYTEAFGDGVAVHAAAAAGENTVLPGEDIRAGQVLFARGTQLAPRHIGALAGAGAARCAVYMPLSIAIISTGDEVKAPSDVLAAGQVRDINTSALAALAQRHGFAVKHRALLNDDEQLLLAEVNAAMVNCDIVLVSGGSSQGEKDATARILDTAANPGVFTHGLALKPGKPTILAYDKPSETLLCGLPGHPVSAMMVFELLIAWFARAKTGAPEPPAIPARISVNLASSPGKLNCWPVRLAWEEGGWQAIPVFGKSGLITTLCAADGYLMVPRSREGVLEGEYVQVHLF